ncbi:hypothetical protein [Aliiroseovarius crassostreae]|uniref:hypothetical protein n=1 Tax=Aliiroseovarius crassostreae TaxID=154981 RepID=UPI00220236A4|nr:hypothetical protein [Aliiroseovarius crassostreae]UWP98660.1 hypothetical protein K3X53_00330 [Aliiroseovarius crassostreae]
MFHKSILAAAVALTAGAASADTMFTVANTFQDPQMTGGNEISTIAFSADVYANQAATVSAGVEIPNFVNFYEIDVAEDMSILTMTVSETAKPANNPMPADRFDRYYYTFTGAGPASASIDADASTAAIAEGATVTVTTTGRLVVAFGEGADFTPGNKVVINLQ